MPGARSFGGAALAAVLAFLFAAFAVVVPGLAGQTGLETRYARVVFNDEADLYEFGRSLGGPGSMASRENPNLHTHVKESVDRIVFRVKALLDMHPAQLRFTVLIHPNDRALREAYNGLGAVGDPPVAFYSHRSRTIHVGLGGAAPGVFAHEVAHAVINSYFTVPPPAQMQEILAQYVDRHLFED
jgi:hypothetical protein